MFNPGMKITQRCNGIVTPTNNGHHAASPVVNSYYVKQKKSESYVSNKTYSCEKSTVDTDILYKCNGFQKPIKLEINDSNSVSHSIIGISDNKTRIKKIALVKPQLKKSNVRGTHHETLQRIADVQDICNHYQQHWFSAGLERLKLEDRSREERLEITRYELKKQLKQIVKGKVGQSNGLKQVASYVDEGLPNQRQSNSKVHASGYDRLVAPRHCDIERCRQIALPCARYCTRHIMHNTEQVLFDYCTAKFADNTQCSVPVFDITHELPLCPEHARKRDNYKLYQEAKPKKLRKKVKPSAMIRPQKRNKKKKKPISKPPEITAHIIETPCTAAVAEVVQEEHGELAEDMVEQVLAMQEEPDGLELVSVEHALVTQASHLLEETDINTVLSTIQADEFNDLFTVNRNGEYEPSREEAEELERALAAVDNDVKSLEKLSQSQGLLDSLLDENTLVESLVQIPDMFHNGYAQCGDSMVAQTSSRLLPVEPHSHS